MVPELYALQYLATIFMVLLRGEQELWVASTGALHIRICGDFLEWGQGD